jgi:lipid A 4'-phosphatase
VRIRKIDTFATITIPAFILLLATILIRLFDFDMRVQRHFWDDANSTWRYAEEPWAIQIYNLGVVPALLIGMICLVVLLLGIGRQDLARFRKTAGYLVLTLIIGSGLFTNALLKGLWGRPRPSQLVEFGGSQAFEPVLVWVKESFGKSFPCGHATMGFYFFAVALVIPKRMVILRIVVAVFGLILGTALSWVRSAQGGHFLSDAIWAAAIMWFVSIGLFHAMRLSEGRKYTPRHSFQRQVPTWAMLCYAPVIGLALLLCLLGTPYKESYALKNSEPFTSVRRVIVDIEGEVKIVKGKIFQVEGKSEGFGVPNSSQRFQHRIDEKGDLHIKGVRKGFFTELRVSLTITIPENQMPDVVCEGAAHLISTTNVVH